MNETMNHSNKMSGSLIWSPIIPNTASNSIAPKSTFLFRYPNLHVSTVQDLRNEIYIRDTNHMIISDLNHNQYAVYEYYRSK